MAESKEWRVKLRVVHTQEPVLIVSAETEEEAFKEAWKAWREDGRAACSDRPVKSDWEGEDVSAKPYTLPKAKPLAIPGGCGVIGFAGSVVDGVEVSRRLVYEAHGTDGTAKGTVEIHYEENGKKKAKP